MSIVMEDSCCAVPLGIREEVTPAEKAEARIMMGRLSLRLSEKNAVRFLNRRLG